MTDAGLAVGAGKYRKAVLRSSTFWELVSRVWVRWLCVREQSAFGSRKFAFKRKGLPARNATAGLLPSDVSTIFQEFSHFVSWNQSSWVRTRTSRANLELSWGRDFRPPQDPK